MTDLTIRGLDLTGRVLDLTKVLAQPDTLVAGAIEFGQWLERERLPKDELAACCAKAKDLVVANSNCDPLIEQVVGFEGIQQIWQFVIKQAGALGRLLIKDPHLAWLATTTICLSRFHDEKVIADALCMIILQNDQDCRGKENYELRWLPSRVELRSIMDRIVGSVWINIVNREKPILDLPHELLSICEMVHHHLDADKLGIVVHTLLQYREKIVLETSHLLVNLTSWLLLHFHGKLVVSVSGTIVYTKDLGNSERIVELKVKKFCSRKTDCSKEEDWYKVYTTIGESLEELLQGTYPSAEDFPPLPTIRKSLYEVQKVYDIKFSDLPDPLRIDCRRIAQQIVAWLVSLPLVSPVDFSDFGLSVQSLHPKGKDASPLTIGKILQRSPSILHHKLGQQVGSSTIYVPPDTSSDADTESSGNIAKQSAYSAQSPLLECMPIYRQLIKDAKKLCYCQDCASHRQDDDPIREASISVEAGCLAELAMAHTEILLGHAVAESFGAMDASGSRNASPILDGVNHLFKDLLTDQQIRWDIWFSVAACVYLGCPFQAQVMDIDSGGTSYAAIQYGNLGVLASWLDMSKTQDLLGCFSFRPVHGQLGVMREGTGSEQYRGIRDRFAIVQTEHTEDTSNYNKRFSKWEEAFSNTIHIDEDNSSVAKEVMLMEADREVYRLIVRFQSDISIRIVDPVDNMVRLARSIPIVTCNHKTKSRMVKVGGRKIKYYTFDDLLVRWLEEEQFYGPNKAGAPLPYHNSPGKQVDSELVFHITSIIKHPEQVNIAQALASNYLLVRNDGDACMECALEKARTMPLEGELEGLRIVVSNANAESARSMAEKCLSRKMRVYRAS